MWDVSHLNKFHPSYLRNQVCPEEGITPKFRFYWIGTLNPREGSRFLRVHLLAKFCWLFVESVSLAKPPSLT